MKEGNTARGKALQLNGVSCAGESESWMVYQLDLNGSRATADTNRLRLFIYKRLIPLRISTQISNIVARMDASVGFQLDSYHARHSSVWYSFELLIIHVDLYALLPCDVHRCVLSLTKDHSTR